MNWVIKLKQTALAAIFLMALTPLVMADVYINVMAVNPTQEAKDTTVKFNLPVGSMAWYATLLSPFSAADNIASALMNNFSPS